MRAVAAVLLTLAVAMGACAEDPRVAEEQAKAAAAAARPWEPARAALGAATAKFKLGGILAIEPLLPDLEKALAGAPEAIAKGLAGPNRVWLVDGPAETAAATRLVGASPGGAVLESPYPLIGMMLGSYYVETRRPGEAIRVLDAGLALPPAIPGVPRAMVPVLNLERANALGQGGRWQDALVAWERTLRLPDLDTPLKARLLRGRGVALIELKRLNEAELSFRSALALEPDNAHARNELDYIAALRAGRPAVKPGPAPLPSPSAQP